MKNLKPIKQFAFATFTFASILFTSCEQEAENQIPNEAVDQQLVYDADDPFNINGVAKVLYQGKEYLAQRTDGEFTSEPLASLLPTHYRTYLNGPTGMIELYADGDVYEQRMAQERNTLLKSNCNNGTLFLEFFDDELNEFRPDFAFRARKSAVVTFGARDLDRFDRVRITDNCNSDGYDKVIFYNNNNLNGLRNDCKLLNRAASSGNCKFTDGDNPSTTGAYVLTNSSNGSKIFTFGTAAPGRPSSPYYGFNTEGVLGKNQVNCFQVVVGPNSQNTSRVYTLE